MLSITLQHKVKMSGNSRHIFPLNGNSFLCFKTKRTKQYFLNYICHLMQPHVLFQTHHLFTLEALHIYLCLCFIWDGIMFLPFYYTPFNVSYVQHIICTTVHSHLYVPFSKNLQYIVNSAKADVQSLYSPKVLIIASGL